MKIRKISGKFRKIMAKRDMQKRNERKAMIGRRNARENKRTSGKSGKSQENAGK